MKYLYRMNSAPAGRYYDEETVRKNVSVIKLDHRKERELYCGTLWYDKKGQPWAIVESVERETDFPSIADAYNALAAYLDHQEVPFCISFG